MKLMENFENLKVGDFLLFIKIKEKKKKWLAIITERKKDRIGGKSYALFSNKVWNRGNREDFRNLKFREVDSSWEGYKLNKGEKEQYGKELILIGLK